MIGAIAGDIIGSIYEGQFVGRTNFPLFAPGCRFTDDSVLTCAVAEHLLDGTDLVRLFKDHFRAYPHAGYGGSFIRWAGSDRVAAYNSFGNGSAMRVSPVAHAFNDLDEVLEHARRTAAVTHDHPEGTKGAQAIAAAIFLARTGHDKGAIASYVTRTFGYNLDRTVEELCALGEFDVTCQKTVPQAITAFLGSDDFESAVRNAIAIGGDSDTLACMAGGIAEAYYGGVPASIVERTHALLDERLGSVARRFIATFGLA